MKVVICTNYLGQYLASLLIKNYNYHYDLNYFMLRSSINKKIDSSIRRYSKEEFKGYFARILNRDYKYCSEPKYTKRDGSLFHSIHKSPNTHV